MFNKWFGVISFLSILVFGIVPARAEILLQALVDGYGYSSDVDAQLARIRRAIEAIKEADIGDDFTLDLLGSSSGGYTENYNRTSENDSAGISLVLNAELRGTLPILRPVTPHEIALRKASLEQERYGLAEAVSKLFGSIASSYNEVYSHTKKLQLFEDAERRAFSQVEAASERFAVGQITRSDVARAKALLAQAQSELLDAKTRVNLAWISLSNLVGKRYDNVEEPLLDIALPVNEEEAVAWALADNVGVALARSQVETGAVNIRLADANDDLRFDLVLSIRKAQPLTSNDLNETDSFSVSLGGNLAYPLYDGGKNASQISQSEIAYVEALDRLNQARINAEREAESVVENVVAIEALLEANKVEIEAQTIALDGVREEEAVGTKALVDVLNAERDLLLVQMRAIDSEAVSASNRFFIYQVTGRLGYSTLLTQQASEFIDKAIVERDWLDGRGSLSSEFQQ